MSGLRFVLVAICVIAGVALGLVDTIASVRSATTRTIYVDCTNTTGLEDGTEPYPYNTIQEGIDAAGNGDTVLVRPCTYYENINLFGRAITVTGTAPLDPLVVSATVIDGGNAGSAVTFSSGEGPASILEGCTIVNGSAANGGGIYCVDSAPTVRHNLIIGNSAAQRGGGVYCLRSSPAIEANTISGNSAEGGGGGVHCQDSSPVVTNNLLTGNSGGHHGGAIYCDDSYLVISSCTIADNTATSGGGIYCRWYSSLTVLNSIVWDNTIRLASGATVSVAHSDTLTFQDGPGNISADPNFDANFRLLRHSPCIDAGVNEGAPPDDIDGDPRPFPVGGRIDMGADEWVGQRPWPCVPGTIHVDCNSACPTPDGSQYCPYRLIQDGIDAACDGYAVVVQPGTYYENIVFRGKGITVSSTDPLDPSVVDSTVIDGGTFGSVVTFANGEGADSVLAGFTVTNGWADYSGGGIYCGPRSSPTIRHSHVTGNSTAGNGGGIFCYYSSAIFDANTVTGNSAWQCGGGIHCTTSSPMITENVVSANDAWYGSGGAISCVLDSAAVISGNVITGNVAGTGGGIYCWQSGPSIERNLITGNEAADSYGGGIYCYDASPTLTSNIISTNTALAGGGGMYCVSSSRPALVNNVVTRNTAEVSGGVRCYYGSSPTITHCTIADNVGGGVGARTDSPLSVTNSIICDGIDVDGTSPIGVTYSDVCAGVQAPWPGQGNICGAPQFADPGNGDYHITLGSPCIGAGTYEAAPPDDIDGQPRPLPDGASVDMGADEWMPMSPLCFELEGNCWHMITLACMPNSADPWEVFDELRPPNKPLDLLSGNLHRYDHAQRRYVTYYQWAPTDFGLLTVGDGYWLWLFEDESLCYEADCAGTAGFVSFSSPGWHLVGCPRPADTYIGYTPWYHSAEGPRSFSEIMNVWLQDPLVHWSCASGYVNCGLLATDQDPYLRTFHGYWLYTFVDDVTMEVPAP